MPLPEIDEQNPNARYKPTVEFVEGMIEGFKNGGKLPKRVVWEIVLGCKAALDRERSLVEVELPEGVTCDIVGDSEFLIPFDSTSRSFQTFVLTTMVLLLAHGVSIYGRS